MKNNQPSSSRVAAVALGSSFGLLLLAIATVIPVASGGFPSSPWYKYIYAAGAIFCIVAALFNPCTSKNLRNRRWHRLEAWSSIFFCAAAVFLFLPGAAPRDWLAFTLAGAVVRIICFVRTLRKPRD